MKIDPFKALKANVSAFALTTILVGCAGPQQGSLFENSSNAIRAAETAGAREFAPTQYSEAAQAEASLDYLRTSATSR